VAVGDVPARLRHVAGCSVCHNDDPASMAAELESVLRRSRRTNGRSFVGELDEHLLTEQLIRIYTKAVETRARSC